MKFATGDVRIKTTIEPTTGWALNPVPNNGQSGSTCDSYDGRPCAGCPTLPSMAEAAAANMTNIHCPGAYYPGGATSLFPNQLNPLDGTGMLGRRTAIQDLVRVPKVPPGEYVVGFRWDCETSSQVWSTCADITIV